MAELEGAALEKVLAGNKIGAGIGAGGELEGIEGGEAARQALTAKGAGTKAAIAKGAAAKGMGATIFSGKGLGLGLGLGSWGPVILGAIGAMAVYAYWKKRRNSYDQSETDAEIKDALG